MRDNLFSNEQLVFIFETSVVSMLGGERLIKMAEEKEKELNNLTTDNPFAKAIVKIVNELKGGKSDIEDFKSGKSESGRKFQIVCSIVKDLSLPYYAITGKTIDDLRKDFDKDSDFNNKLDTIIKNFT